MVSNTRNTALHHNNETFIIFFKSGQFWSNSNISTVNIYDDSPAGIKALNFNEVYKEYFRLFHTSITISFDGISICVSLIVFLFWTWCGISLFKNFSIKFALTRCWHDVQNILSQSMFPMCRHFHFFSLKIRVDESRVSNNLIYVTKGL